MRFYPDFRDSNSRRLTIALLFSLVLHTLLLVFVRFAQPSWKDSASKTTTLNVILQKTKVAEVAPPPGIPAASQPSKGEAKTGVQAATPVPQKVPPAITLAPESPRMTEPPKPVTEARILAMNKPAKLTVPESIPEVKVAKNLPAEEKTKPLAPAPSVENPLPKVAPPVEEPKQIVTVEAVQEKPVTEIPPVTSIEPAKVEEPKPVKAEAPLPVKVEEPKPIKMEEPKPVKVEEPKPVKIEEPKPVKVEESRPAKVEEPKPVKVEEPKPVKIEEPQPVRIEQPKPAIIEEAKPGRSEVAAAPKASIFDGSGDAPAKPPGYAVSRMSDTGFATIRSLPKIAEKKLMFGERRKTINSKEQELRYVMYLESVKLKLQRIGQFNYPAEAARRNLGGSLVVQFSIRADGSLEELSIVQPSPHESLNAGAEKIIRMCAPFSPLPDNIRKDTDILTIRLNWNFTNSRQLLD